MLTDTSVDALEMQIALLRRASLGQRLQLTADLTTAAAELSRSAIRRANPQMTDLQAKLQWAELHYGKKLADDLRRHLGMETS